MSSLCHCIAIAMLIIPLFAFPQTHLSCATPAYHRHQLVKHPGLFSRMAEIEAHAQRYLHRPPSARDEKVFVIPVVVHVVYYKSFEKIREVQVKSQIAALNKDFQQASDAITDQWPQAGEAKIQFRLAQINPEGKPTTGITYTRTQKSSFKWEDDEVKFSQTGGKDAWPTQDYLNIWVCDVAGLLGYAQPPGGDPATDGVVIDFLRFGTLGTAIAPYNLGHTATHEIGHWLNLKHIWGDGPCGTDDGISDTPEAEGPNYQCGALSSSCGSIDMIENFMDYTEDACKSLFTKEQSIHMRAMLDEGGPRASLQSSPALGGPLPVSWLDFQGTATESGVTLTWSTREERNAYYFSIEHQQANRSFQAIGRVEARGNTQVVSTYQSTHLIYTPGPHYFRLKQVDQDGNYSYSAIIEVHMIQKPAAVRALYDSDQHLWVLEIRGKPGDFVRVSLFDQGGREVCKIRTQLDCEHLQIPVRTPLSQGLYVYHALVGRRVSQGKWVQSYP